MTSPVTIETERLILRPWSEADLAPFAALNADPRVMECFPSVKTFDESNQEYERICGHIHQHGYGFWAAELKTTHQFIGFIGIKQVMFETPFTPAVEIGWRLAHEFWGKGYATEGAKAALEYGFKNLKLDEIVSFTVLDNIRSQSVMQKIGMTHDLRDDFDHPLLPKNHQLSRHVLYRIKNT
jgi:3-dehydroquinate dehydratase/shikimate dehydrogenase